MTQPPETEKQRLPGSVRQVYTATKFELLNYFRARRFYVLLGITVLIGILLTAVVAHYRPASYVSTTIGDQTGFYYNWWGTWIGFVIILSGIFFGGDAISGEFQNKTGYFLVPNPIRRATIYIGKWLAALIASVLILAVYAVMTIANGVYYFGWNIPYQFGESILFALLYLIAVLGFTFFFSSLFKSASISILITTILFLFLFNVISQLVRVLAQTEPWFVLTYGAEVIQDILSNPYPLTHTTQVGPRVNFTQFQVPLQLGLEIMLGYFLVTAVLGLILFERREFN